MSNNISLCYLKGWIEGKNKNKTKIPYYFMFNPYYGLKALVDKQTGIVFLITDIVKDKVVYDPKKEINEGENYEHCF
jgi:hypothetical protein